MLSRRLFVCMYVCMYVRVCTLTCGVRCADGWEGYLSETYLKGVTVNKRKKSEGEDLGTKWQF